MPPPSRIVVVGASAGGLEALKRLVNGLPAGFPAALLLVLHIPAQSPSLLARILDRSGPLPATDAVDAQRIETGHVYEAVPDRHLLVDRFERHAIAFERKRDVMHSRIRRVPTRTAAEAAELEL